MVDHVGPNLSVLEKIRDGTATKQEISSEWLNCRMFVCKIANLYKGALRTSDEVDDLVQEGFFCFMDAAKSYDAEKGSFLSWMAFFLHNSFSEYVGRNSGRSRRDQGLLYSIRSFISSYERDHGRKPSTIRISEELHISEEKVIEVVNSELVKSMEEPITDDLTLSDEIQDERCMEDDVINEMIGAKVSRMLHEEIQQLPFHERRAIIAIYIYGMTDQRAAAVLGGSEETIRNARERGLRKLRNNRLRSRLGKLLPDRFGSEAYRGGLQTFTDAGSSVTERLAIKLLEWEENKNA